MEPRQRVLTALSGVEPDRPPKCARFTPPVMRMFNEKVEAGLPEKYLKKGSIPTGFITEVVSGAKTPDEYFNWDLRHVNFKSPPNKDNNGEFLKELPEEGWVNDWGVGIIPQRESHYIDRMFPLKGKSPDPALLEDYPFPDFMEERCHSHLDRQIQKMQKQGYAVAGFLQETIFEVAWAIRGYKDLFSDFVKNPKFATTLLNKITEIRCRMAARYARAGVDIIRLGDDVGTQESLMMSPKMWREWLKPRLTEVIKSIRDVNSDVHIFYHTDGYVEPLIEEFIEIGIDILNPVQPECMSPKKLKEDYGDSLSFWGTIGTQTTMPFATPDEIREVVQEKKSTVGKGGGLIIAPTHALQPDVPWENIITLFEAVEGGNSK